MSGQDRLSTLQTRAVLIMALCHPLTFDVVAAQLFGISPSSALHAGGGGCGAGLHGGELGAWTAAAAFGYAGQDGSGGGDHRQAGGRPLPRQWDHRCHSGEGADPTNTLR